MYGIVEGGQLPGVPLGHSPGGHWSALAPSGEHRGIDKSEREESLNLPGESLGNLYEWEEERLAAGDDWIERLSSEAANNVLSKEDIIMVKTENIR